MSDENSVDATLEKLQHESFKYFLHETNPANGLVIDKNEANWQASIAATGLALALSLQRSVYEIPVGWCQVPQMGYQQEP